MSSLGSGVTDATTANVPLALTSLLKEELKPGTTLPSLGSDAAVISSPAGHSESGKEEKPFQPKLVVGASGHAVSVLPCVKEMALVFGQHDPSPVVPFYLNNLICDSTNYLSKVKITEFWIRTKTNPGGKEVQPKNIPMNGLMHGPSVRPWDSKVPIFDNVQPFRLTEYTKLMSHFEELNEGDFALIVFTVSRLSEFNEDDADKADYPLLVHLVDETALGVDNTAPMTVEKVDLSVDYDVKVPSSNAGLIF
ncbi:hypothetical protein ARMGADRAFT_1038596 [Armillaria gallica]|uniref:Uncharacterized protein n=1 Tax=Armillaria gallica TaxID=47427 RepID=A0A2H3D4L5_ARMGA|nr:hypothetical protein ARMGADRAFT_1038596 [Armillaria gallica]